MYIKTRTFSDKETLLKMLKEFESAIITDEFAVITRPIVDEAEDEHEADDMIADALLKAYDNIEVVVKGNTYYLNGISASESTLLATLKSEG